MKTHFNSLIKILGTTFFGILMSLTEAFNFFAEYKVKFELDYHSKKQANLGKSIRSVTISGIEIRNWADKKEKFNFIWELMAVESIHEKTNCERKKYLKIQGMTFYAVIPDELLN